MLRGDQPGRDARQRYGLEIFDDVVWEIVDGAVDDLRGPGSVKKRIAIGRGARDPAHAERSRGAGHVLNYHGLAEARSHALGDNARDRIHLATSGDRNDYAHRTAGIGVRRFDARRDWQCGGSCGEAQKAAARKFHLLPGGLPRQSITRLLPPRAALPAALIAVLGRSDIGRDGARRGADHRAWIALRPHGGQKGRIHAAVSAARNRHSRDAAVDQLYGLNLVATLLLAYGHRDVLFYLVGWTSRGRTKAAHRFCVENVALLAYVDPGLEVCNLEVVVTFFDHFPECHMRRVAVAGHVERRHPEWIGLQLKRFLLAEESFARERVDFRDLLVGHGIAAGRRAAAVDHQERASAAVRPIVGIRKSRIDREILAGVRIHQARGNGVKALGRLAVAGLELGAEFPRPAADRISTKERKSPTVVLLPNLELGLLLEDPHQDRRFLVHVLCFQRREHPFRQWLHVAAAGHRWATAAPGKRHVCDDRRRRQKRTQQRS